jgi:hypothetical protein
MKSVVFCAPSPSSLVAPVYIRLPPVPLGKGRDSWDLLLASEDVDNEGDGKKYSQGAEGEEGPEVVVQGVKFDDVGEDGGY